MTAAVRGLVVRPDEGVIRMYKWGDIARHGQSWFNRSAVPFRGGISVLELRLDGFASLHSPNHWQADGSKATAVALSHALLTNGTSLHINMVAANGAYLQVGVTGTGGEPLSGLSAGECVQLGGNLLDQEVIWRTNLSDGRRMGALAKPFRLQLVMHGEVDLFSFRFTHTK